MRKLRRIAAALTLVPFGSLLAQGNSECSPYSAISQTYNVCNAAIDATVLFHPVVGLLISGGDPVIGTARTHGGFPHLSLTVRANASQFNIPETNYDGSTTTVPSKQKTWIGAPMVEGSLGLFGGLNNGFLAVDALGSALLLPTSAVDNLKVDPNATKIGSVALGIGYGARVGIFNGKAIIPAVSATIMARSVPRVTYGDVASGDQYDYSVNLHATNLRVMAGYKLSLLSLAAGLGWDKYTGDATIDFRDPLTSTVQPPISKHLDQSRTMMMADAGLDLPVLKIAAEIGYQFGKSQTLATTFQGNNPSDGRVFFGAGLRLSF